MAPVYWLLAGLVAGIATGRLVRFHTVHWSTAVDAVIGIICAIGGATVFRGFGVATNGNWKLVTVALISGVVGTFIVNDLARTREEEIDEHVVAEHKPAYAALDHSWEERLLHMSNDPIDGALDSQRDEGHSDAAG